MTGNQPNWNPLIQINRSDQLFPCYIYLDLRVPVWLIYSQQLNDRKSAKLEPFDPDKYNKETADHSLHASKQPIMLTYDATIPINKIVRGSDNDEKRAYI